MTPRLRPAVFLDRDGVLVEDVGYLSRPDQLSLLPGAAAAVARLREAGYLVVLVTNQSGVARGMFGEDALARIHDSLEQALAREGARLDGIFYCPHHPTEGRPPYRAVCACRKPEPGMLLTAAEALGIDLGSSWMVGDKLGDVAAGHRAGCRGILVSPDAASVAGAATGLERPDLAASSLEEAAGLVLGCVVRSFADRGH